MRATNSLRELDLSAGPSYDSSQASISQLCPGSPNAGVVDRGERA